MSSLNPEPSKPEGLADSTEIRRETTMAVRNAALLTLSLFGTLSVAVGVRVWMPRFLGPEAFGVLHFGEELTAACLFFTTLGVETYIKRDVATRPEHASEFFGGLLQVRLLATIIVGVAIAGLLTMMGKSALEWRLVYLFALGQTFFVLNVTLASYLQARGTVRELALINVGSKLLWGASIVVGLSSGAQVTFVALTFSFTEALKTPLLYIACRKHLGLRLSWRLQPILGVLGFSMPYYLNQLTHEIYGRAGASFLSGMANDREVGWYGAANHVKTLLFLALPILQAVVLPMGARLAQRSVSALNEMMRGCLRLVLSIASPLAWVLALNAGDLVLLLFTDAYAPAARNLRLLSALVPLACICVLASMHLLQLGKIWEVTKISLLGLVVNLASMPWLIRLGAARLGVGGAGAGACVAALLTETTVAVLLLRALGPAGVNRRLFHHVARLGLTAAIVAVAHMLLRPLGIARLGIDAILSVVAGALLGAIPVLDIVTQVRAAYASRHGGRP